jgi:Uncharacterized protein conserved in bacteria (DUF2188)
MAPEGRRRSALIGSFAEAREDSRGTTRARIPSTPARMQNFHLSPDGDAWKLTTEDGRLTIDDFDSRKEALEASCAFMDRRSGSLKILKADGTFEAELTYPRARDSIDVRG